MQVVDAVGNFTKCSSVVDVGAGQGHLSRILHFGYGFNVTTIEASGCHAPKAQKYDAEVQKDITKGHSKKVRLFLSCNVFQQVGRSGENELFFLFTCFT